MTDTHDQNTDLSDLGDRETDILQALWRLDRPVSVAAVHTELEDQGINVAYTTVQTMLNRLVDKGRVGRQREGRAYLYRAETKQASVAGAALSRILNRFFEGSPEALAVHLVGKMSSDERERVRNLIDQSEVDDKQ